MGGASNVEMILRLCTGDIEAVYDLSDVSTGALKMKKPELVEAVMFFTYQGRQVFEMPAHKNDFKEKIPGLKRSISALIK